MADVRERLFRCEFIGESVHLYAHVRAWDASDAIGAFVAELREDDVDVAGEIVVTPTRGGAPAVRVDYHPAEAPPPRSPEPASAA